MIKLMTAVNTTRHTSAKRRILIVGGGFAGVRVARQLARRRDLQITLVSQDTYFAYYPQLYHAATGGSRSGVSIPLIELLGGSKIRIVQDKAMALDTKSCTLIGTSGTIYYYDELVLALGSITNYFGIAGLKNFAYDIKTIAGAEAFKEHLHHELVERHKPEIHYIIIGGGATGVELSAALGEYLRRIIKLHGIKKPKYSVELIEAAPRILPHSSARYARKVEQRLAKLGVKVITGSSVVGETAEGLQMKGKTIETQTVVWTSGVANNPFFADNASQFELAKNGRIVVNDHMESSPHVYVIGDNADSQYAGLAETAINDGNFVARDIQRKSHGSSRPAYRQKAPASVIPVGSNWAAAKVGPFTFYGYAGWLIRRLADLIAYRDIESTSRALRVWLGETTHEDDCATCLQNQLSA